MRRLLGAIVLLVSIPLIASQSKSHLSNVRTVELVAWIAL